MFIRLLLVLLLLPTVASAQTPWWRLTKATNTADIEALSDEAVEKLKIPVLIGIKPGDFKDTYGVRYTNGSNHEGIDIFAPRGAYIVSPTEAVVTRIDSGGRGGIAVYTANPGDETFYYAHMTAVGPTITLGATLKPGDLIGYTGNTGAESSSPHLHFQIFTLDGVINPFSRLTETFSDEERVEALERIAKRSDNEALAASAITKLYGSFLKTLPTSLVPKVFVGTSEEKPLPVTPVVAGATTPEEPTKSGVTITENLRVGARNGEVQKLQEFLIKEGVGEYAQTLKTYGATGYFGVLTKLAVAEYQKENGIIPASGYCGPATRAYIAKNS